MKKVVRFAPSPTGMLHIGNARIALINWLYTQLCKKNGIDAEFILRIDDTDTARSEEEYVKKIKEDLIWLGYQWDTCFRQSERFDKYELCKNKLIKEGRLYPCYETQEELSIKRKSQLNRNLPPVYDRAALLLTKEQREEIENKGIQPHWRFLLKNEHIEWTDKIRGDVKIHSSTISDPVLIRADGTMTYTLCSIVDDIDYGVTDIIRGEDHMTNSAAHIQIFHALHAQYIPDFTHISLFTAKDQEISKRSGEGEFSIASLRKNLIDPMAINSLLATLGTSDSIDCFTSMDEILEHFALRKFGKARVIYDEKELNRLNAKIIRKMSYLDIRKKLAQHALPEIDEDFWYIIRDNIDNIKDLKLWWNIFHKEMTPQIIDLKLTQTVARILLTKKEWKPESWNDILLIVKQETGKSGAAIFMPIRMALTGMKHGPQLYNIIKILGHDRACARLNGDTA